MCKADLLNQRASGGDAVWDKDWVVVEDKVGVWDKNTDLVRDEEDVVYTAVWEMVKVGVWEKGLAVVEGKVGAWDKDLAVVEDKVGAWDKDSVVAGDGEEAWATAEALAGKKAGFGTETKAWADDKDTIRDKIAGTERLAMVTIRDQDSGKPLRIAICLIQEVQKYGFITRVRSARKA